MKRESPKERKEGIVGMGKEWGRTLQVLARFYVTSIHLLLLSFSHWLVSNSLQPHGQKHSMFPCLSVSLGVFSDSSQLNQWCYLTISSSTILFSFAFNLSQHQGLFQRVSSSLQVLKVFELQHQSFQRIFRAYTNTNTN